MTLNLILISFAWVVPYLLIVMVLLYVFKLIYDKITHYDDDAQLRSGNFAVGLGRASMYIGLTLAMCGPLLSQQQDFWWDLLMYTIEGVAAVVVMTLASFVFDRVILPRIDNRKEIGAGNVAVAVVEAAAYIGLGFIMLSSLAGAAGPTLVNDILSGLLFIVLGLGTLMGIYWLFVLVYKSRKVNVIKEIEAGNVAIAIEAAGVLLAISTLLGFSIIGDFRGWAIDIVSYLIAAVAGVLAVVVAQIISRLLFNRGGTLREDGAHAANISSASVNAGLLVSLGVVAGLVTFI